MRTTIDPRMAVPGASASDRPAREARPPGRRARRDRPLDGRGARDGQSTCRAGGSSSSTSRRQGGRQAGTSFKPFTLATALNEGISLQSTFSGPPSLTIPDPQCAFNGEPWDVHNYADETARHDEPARGDGALGEHDLRAARRQGRPSKVAITAHRMGIRSPLQPVCSITLGHPGGEPARDDRRVRDVRLARHPPRPAGGPARPRPEGRHPREARESGRARAARDDGRSGHLRAPGRRDARHRRRRVARLRPAAGKTGTAENSVDAWFCGYTPQLATCVWVGYPKAEIPLGPSRAGARSSAARSPRGSGTTS